MIQIEYTTPEGSINYMGQWVISGCSLNRVTARSATLQATLLIYKATQFESKNSRFYITSLLIFLRVVSDDVFGLKSKTDAKMLHHKTICNDAERTNIK